MKVRFTEAALKDIDEIRDFLLSNYPSAAPLVEKHIRMITRRIGAWPESSPRVAGYPGLRAATLGRFPYRLFYVIDAEAIADSSYPPHIEAAVLGRRLFGLISGSR